jgi:16S rRNA (cytosine1402-N4)-methyltransferase
MSNITTSSTFFHRSVLLHEAVAALALKPNGIYVDATYGGGGHSREILAHPDFKGKLLAFDQDADAWKNTHPDERLITVNENFRYMQRFLRLHGIKTVDGILADLGVSSHQFDTPERGFSTRYEGPLDMRMDPRNELTASKIISEYDENELVKIFEQYGEVRNSKQLAKHIVLERKKRIVKTTAEFKAMLEPVVKGLPQKYLAQAFQALRIEVNDELGNLKELLLQAPAALNPGGRLVIISFHSLEDRLVKQFLKQGNWDEAEQSDNRQEKTFKIITPKPIEPGEEELRQNPRARSAKLRIGEKI